ncbi:unnamed protein product [Rotaria sp. Silwood1]|nr:unnamed protein product [Rotaria sp. Silwood1]
MTSISNVDDELAIKVGKLYVDTNKKFKDQLVREFDALHLAMIQSKVTGLQAQAANYQNKANELEKEATAAKKQANEKLEQLKRKYDSI